MKLLIADIEYLINLSCGAKHKTRENGN